MSLSKPHPICTKAGSNPNEVAKAVQQAQFLSGRYQIEYLARHLTSNREGYCLSPTCRDEQETTEHIHRQAYTNCKRRLYSLWLSTEDPIVYNLVLEALSSETNYLLHFILDCSQL